VLCQERESAPPGWIIHDIRPLSKAVLLLLVPMKLLSDTARGRQSDQFPDQAFAVGIAEIGMGNIGMRANRARR
jgi:hypothetical protein